MVYVIKNAFASSFTVNVGVIESALKAVHIFSYDMLPTVLIKIVG